MQTRIQILETIEGLKLQTLRNLDAYKEAWMALPSNDPAAKELQVQVLYSQRAHKLRTICVFL